MGGPETDITSISPSGDVRSGSQNIRVKIISGLSGAGKTIALRALEDVGYFCIDNLPAKLIESFLLTVTAGDKIRNIGIGIDIREKDFLGDAYQIFTGLRKLYNVEVLFFEAESEVMLRRYKETRRPHPIMSLDKSMSMDKAIEEEKSFLVSIRESADRIIDTSNYSPHQLRNIMTAHYAGLRAEQAINITIMSFGFKFGVPQNIDLLFDARFLPNPYFVPELKHMKGTDRAVADFVVEQDETREYMEHITKMLEFLVPRYIKEGRAYLVIGIGCTGGRHRSPAIVGELSKFIEEKLFLKPTVIHRDME
ncbi:MAG: RNase adapter RapZ [Nitrospirae bacterium]|nr:MAG: RNase adapter RapZ [Nitrospirota bacterium]